MKGKEAAFNSRKGGKNLLYVNIVYLEQLVTTLKSMLEHKK